MAEISRKVVPYEYNYLCDSCKGGMMTFIGEKTSEGYRHQCVICGHKADLNMEYPHVEYYGEDEHPGH